MKYVLLAKTRVLSFSVSWSHGGAGIAAARAFVVDSAGEAHH